MFVQLNTFGLESFGGNHDDCIVQKSLDSDSIEDLKDIIDSVNAGFSTHPNADSLSNNQIEYDSSDDDEDENTLSDNASWNFKSSKSSPTEDLSSDQQQAVNLNSLKICIDDIEELNDKTDRSWFVFVIHIWNIKDPQQFDANGDSLTSWSVKR